MSAPERHLITVEINVAAGQTLHETVDWLNRFFSYYHQGLNAVVQLKGKSSEQVKPVAEEPLPGADLLG